MATRVVEGKKPYTGGKAISIDENKAISLNLRDENNLIIYDSGDDEIYVDLQLDDEITPTSAFPIGVNTGRVIVDNGWDKAGTIICAKTTSGDNIKLFYADEGTLWIDNGTGTFKQIYFKADVDALLLALRNYIDGELAKKQNGVSSDTAPEDPAQGDLWYDTINDVLKVYDGSQWNSTGGGSDIEYVTQAEYNALLPGALTDNKHYFIYSTSGGGGWQPGADTLVYLPLATNSTDQSGNGNDGTDTNITYTDGKAVFSSDGTSCILLDTTSLPTANYTLHMIIARTTDSGCQISFRYSDSGGYDNARSYISGYGTYTAGGVEHLQTDLSICNSADRVNYGLIATDTTEHLLSYVVYEQGGDTSIKFYIDGAYQTSRTATTTYYTGAKIGLGNRWYNPNEGLKGTMREVILEDKVRTDAEVLALAQQFGFA